MNKDYSKVNNFCLVLLTGVAVTTALIYTRAILVPFVFSLFFYFVASPFILFFQTKAKFPRYLAVSVTFCMVLAILGALFFLVSSSLGEFLKSTDAYTARIMELTQWGTSKLSAWGYSLDADLLKRAITKLPVLAFAKNLSGGFVSLLGNLLLIVVFVFFLIVGEGKEEGSRNRLIVEIHNKVSRYVATKSLTSFSTGVLVGLILSIFGVELAFMFAVLTVLLNFIPSIGSLIATLLPLPVIWLQFGLGGSFFAVLILTGAVQFLIGNVLEPKMMGENMDLHPVTILVFLMFWGLVWGIPGMFLAVPITAILKIVLARIEATKPIAEFLAGRIS